MSAGEVSWPRVLIAGIGNIFLGDDAFGVEVARVLLTRSLPDCVRVVDFGIRGLDLAYALLDGYDAVILVDAVPRGERPGTVYVLDIDPQQASATEGAGPLMEAHSMDPVKVLRLVRAMGGEVRRLLLVGCEPTPIDVEEISMGLSTAVRAAVSEAASLIESLVARLLEAEQAASAVHEKHTIT